MLMDLEVYVCSRCPSRISHQRHDLSPPHPLALPYDIAFVMGVEGPQAIPVIKHHCISIAVGPTPAKHHHALRRRHNRCPPLTRNIDTTMKPSASCAKG